jgi:uncharacterized protein (TIGR03437 family)
VGGGPDSDVEQFISRVERLVYQPLPEFKGNWMTDIIQNLYRKSTYQQLYLDGVNARNFAANLLSHAKQFYSTNRPDDARKYAELALQYIQAADKSFALALDVYYSRTDISKIEKPLLVAHNLGMTALSILGATTPCDGLCIFLEKSLSFAVDYSLEGLDEAATKLILNTMVEFLLGKVIDTGELIDSANQWLGSSGLYEKILQAVNTPEFAKQLMSVVATLQDFTIVGAEDLIVNKLRDTLEKGLRSAVYIQPQTAALLATVGTGLGGSGGGKNEDMAAASSVGRWEASPDNDEPTWPIVYSTGILNGASYTGGGVAPGEIVIIQGVNLSPVEFQDASAEQSAEGNVAYSIAGVRVLFNGIYAPLLYVSKTQIGAIVPATIIGRSSVRIQVEYGGIRSYPVEIPVLASHPGLFSADMSGRGQGLILNEDGTLNSPENPAHTDSIVTIYATGGGQIESSESKASDFGGRSLLLPVQVFIGGVPAEVIYAGEGAETIPGLVQIKARIPATAPRGLSVGVLLQVGDAISQPDITISIVQ